MKKIIYILLILILIIIVAGVVIFWQLKNNNSEENEVVPEDKFADGNTYRNEEYGFEIKYPKDTCFRFTAGEEIDCFFALVLFPDLDSSIPEWEKESIEDFRFTGNGITVVDTNTEKVITNSGEIGQMGIGSSAINISGDFAGPIKFVAFPLKNNDGIFLLYYIGSNKDLFSQMLSSFKFID